MDKFDVSKVLTAVTKDNAILGAYGWFGDSISAVEKHYCEEPPKKLKKVRLDNATVFPFYSEDGREYLYFYPALPEEKNYVNLQAEWVEKNNIAVGRKVRVTRKPTAAECSASDVWWGPSYDYMIGNIYPILTISSLWLGLDVSSETHIGVPYTILEVVPVIRTYTDNELNNLVGTVVMSKGWKIKRMITGKLASIDRISVDGQEMSATTLLENYTHLDGSPCGVEV